MKTELSKELIDTVYEHASGLAQYIIDNYPMKCSHPNCDCTGSALKCDSHFNNESIVHMEIVLLFQLLQENGINANTGYEEEDGKFYILVSFSDQNNE